MNQIKVIRAKKRINQTELAAALGVSQATISGWETGRISPRLSDLSKIANVLGCNISELFEEGDESVSVS